MGSGLSVLGPLRFKVKLTAAASLTYDQLVHLFFLGFKFFSIGYTLQVEDSNKFCAVDLNGWVNGMTNEIVEEGSLVGVGTFSSGASEVQSQTATASLTYVKSNGASYTPKCQWKLRRGRFRCVKPRPPRNNN